MVGYNARTIGDLGSLSSIDNSYHSMNDNSSNDTLNLEQPALEDLRWDNICRTFKSLCEKNLDKSSEMYSKIPNIRNSIESLNIVDPYINNDSEIIEALNANNDYLCERVYLLKKVVYNIEHIQHNSTIIELLLKYSDSSTYMAIEQNLRANIHFSFCSYNFILNCLLISGAGINDPDSVLKLYMDYFETYTHLLY